METRKFRIYPNESQKILLAKTFGCTRLIYNIMLDRRITAYKNENISLSCYDCSKMITQLKKLPEYEFLKEVDSSALQASNEYLDRAYKNFFRNKKGFPKFKKKQSKQSFTTKDSKGTFKVINNHIKLPKLGLVKFAKSREIRGRIKTVTLSKSITGKYYMAVTTDYELSDTEKWAKVQKSVGLDLGLSHFVTTSNGEKIENPRNFNKYQEKLAKEQRILARRKYKAKQLGKSLADSKNYQKQKLKVAKIYEKMTNARKDFQHKLSTNIVKNHDIICTETLNIKNMVKNRNLAKSISDVAWGSFLQMLEYKSKLHGRDFRQVARNFASTQICHNCGVKDEPKPLSVREWKCKTCQKVHDRDINAAINILIEATK